MTLGLVFTEKEQRERAKRPASFLSAAYIWRNNLRKFPHLKILDRRPPSPTRARYSALAAFW